MIALLDEMIAQQKEKVLATAQCIVPGVIEDDLLQPNDFPELELHPYFRYEEGMLAGMQAVRAAVMVEIGGAEGTGEEKLHRGY